MSSQYPSKDTKPPFPWPWINIYQIRESRNSSSGSPAHACRSSRYPCSRGSNEVYCPVIKPASSVLDHPEVDHFPSEGGNRRRSTGSPGGAGSARCVVHRAKDVAIMASRNTSSSARSGDHARVQLSRAAYPRTNSRYPCPRRSPCPKKLSQQLLAKIAFTLPWSLATPAAFS